jgi:hypothetical protein
MSGSLSGGAPAATPPPPSQLNEKVDDWAGARLNLNGRRRADRAADLTALRAARTTTTTTTPVATTPAQTATADTPATTTTTTTAPPPQPPSVGDQMLKRAAELRAQRSADTTTTTTTSTSDATPTPARPAQGSPMQAPVEVKHDQAVLSAYQKQAAAVQETFAEADEDITHAKPGGEIGLFSGGYAAAAASLDGLVAAGDYVGALRALQNKVIAAQRVIDAYTWDADPTANSMHEAITATDKYVAGGNVKGGGVARRVAKGGNSKAKDQYSAAVKEFMAAKQEYPNAIAAARENPALYGTVGWAALVKVKKASDKINGPCEALEAKDAGETLIKGVDAIIKRASKRNAKVDPALQGLIKEFKEARAACNNDLEKGDGGTWKKSVKNLTDLAWNIFSTENKQAIDGWYDKQNAQDKQQFDAVGRAAGRTAPSMEVDARKIYANAMIDGERLGVPNGEELTPAQMMALNAYSGTQYARMNTFLRDPPPAGTQPDLRALVDAATEALDRLPKYQGFPVYRWEKPFQDAAKGIDYMEERYQVGKKFVIKEFWSTGANGGAAPDKAKPTAEIVIHGKQGGASNGHDISRMSYYGKKEGGGEILFRPGTEFVTKKVEKHDAEGVPIDTRQGRDSGGQLVTIEMLYIIHVEEV